MVIPLFQVLMNKEMDNELLRVIHSGYIGEGPKVKQFEESICDFIGNKNVVAVNSGTMAITIALKLAGIGYRDRVITSPMTCLATNMAILSVGAIPVWADILPDGTIDPESINGLDGKVIVCVDWGGLPCKLDELKSFGLPVIEDACQSFGGYYKNRPIGNDADYVCFSFQAIKYLTTGDGGAIVVNMGYMQDAKLMRWFGLDRETSASMRCKQDPPFWGYKAQLNDIAATIGLYNMLIFKSAIDIAKRNAAYYDSVFNIKNDNDRISANWLYTIHVDNPDKFIEYMKGFDIECSQAHLRNDTKEPFEGFECYLPGVEKFEASHVCIPVGWWVTEEQVKFIAQKCIEYDEKL